MGNIAQMQSDLYTDAMSTVVGALGGYLKALREGRKLEPKDVLPALSERLGRTVDHSRLWRAENAAPGRWPEGDFLTALLDVIKGDLRDIVWIQEHPNARAEEGRDRALKRLQEAGVWTDEDDEIVRRISQLDPERRKVLLDLLDTWPDTPPS